MTIDKQKYIDGLKLLIEEGQLHSTGDYIVQYMKTYKDAQPQPVPVLTFVRKTEEVPGEPIESEAIGTVSLATPSGLPLFEAKEFYEYCKEKAKSEFFKDLDKMFKQHTALRTTKGTKTN